MAGNSADVPGHLKSSFVCQLGIEKWGDGSPTRSPSLDHGDAGFCAGLFLCKGGCTRGQRRARPVPTLTPCPSKGPTHPQSPCNLLSLTHFVRADGAAENPRRPLQAWSCLTALSFLPWERESGVKAMLLSFPRHPRCREPGTQEIGPMVEVCASVKRGALGRAPNPPGWEQGLGGALTCCVTSGEASSLSEPHCSLL